jgi:hypothetical protein
MTGRGNDFSNVASLLLLWVGFCLTVFPSQCACFDTTNNGIGSRMNPFLRAAQPPERTQAIEDASLLYETVTARANSLRAKARDTIIASHTDNKAATDATPSARQLVPVPASSGAGMNTQSTSSSPQYVQMTIHASHDCSEEVVLFAAYGTNMCLAIASTDEPDAQSMMFQYNASSHVLTETFYADAGCSPAQALHVNSMGSLESALNLCTAGVVVEVVPSFTVPNARGMMVW